jgi:hypothetical protein
MKAIWPRHPWLGFLEEYHLNKILIALLLSINALAIQAQEIDSEKRILINQAEKLYSPSHNVEIALVSIQGTVTSEQSGLYINIEGRESFIQTHLMQSKLLHWTEDEKFLLVDQGTYVYRGFSVFNLETREKIGSVPYLTPEYYWVSDRVIASTALMGDRLDGLIEANGVTLSIIEDTQVRKIRLFTPDELTDYQIDHVENEIVYIKKINLVDSGNPNPWIRLGKLSEEILEVDISSYL